MPHLEKNPVDFDIMPPGRGKQKNEICWKIENFEKSINKAVENAEATYKCVFGHLTTMA